MDYQLERLIQATSHLNIEAFEEELDFMGMYLGLTAYNFSRYLDLIFKDIASDFVEFIPLEAKLLSVGTLAEDEVCYAFFDEEKNPYLCLVFKLKDDRVVDIYDGSKYVAEADSECFCRELLIYEDDKYDYVLSDLDKDAIKEIEQAMSVYDAAARSGLSFTFCHSWFHRYKHLGNQHGVNVVSYYKYRESITHRLYAVNELLRKEIRKQYLELFEEMGEYFDLGKDRESVIFQKIKAHPVFMYDDYVSFYLGYGRGND